MTFSLNLKLFILFKLRKDQLNFFFLFSKAMHINPNYVWSGFKYPCEFSTDQNKKNNINLVKDYVTLSIRRLTF